MGVTHDPTLRYLLSLFHSDFRGLSYIRTHPDAAQFLE